jgi:C-terminal processing protease CtpA/Prc
MRKIIYKILPLPVISLFILFSSCRDNSDYTTDPRENFESLWKIIDERYCFFTYKNIDWNAVHDKYSVQIADTMNRYELFNALGTMLAELQDGHTNLISTFNTSRFWDWSENYPDNFNTVVHKKYLGTGNDYNIAGGLKYRILRDSIGYVYYESFSNAVSESNLNEMFLLFKDCKSFIFDIRNNGGGSLLYSERIASRFLSEKMTVGYIKHKTGTGHDDFSEPHPIEQEPSKYIKWLRPVVLLTNRSCYSAANDLVNRMKLFPQVTIIGDKTGGGCGLPFNSELPNGWGIRFSSSPILDANKEYTEFGVDPDIKVDIKESDQLNNIDTIIEEAIKFLKEKTANQAVSTSSLEYGVKL